MADIYFHNPSDLDLIDRGTRFGIYAIRSKNLLRVGSVGINSEETKLFKRLKLHSSGAGKGNWTVENRPWSLVWAAEIICDDLTPDHRKHGVLALEYALFAVFAGHFRAIATSGFDTDGRVDEIPAIIDAFKGTLQMIANTQFGTTALHPEGTKRTKFAGSSKAP